MQTAVSLTVDVESHGSQSDYEFAEILEVLVGELDTRNIKATFFVNGGVISRWENRIVELHKRGHFIGSHGWSHVPKSIMLDSSILLVSYLERIRNLLTMGRLIFRLSGQMVYPNSLFRC